MGRVGHQLMPAQMLLEDLAAGLDRFLLRHFGEAPAVPGLGQAFDDEGRRVVVELVDMRPDPAVLRLLENEGEGVIEALMRSEPHELALAGVDVGLEHIGIFVADKRVDAVGGNDEIILLAVVLGCLELGLETHVHAKFAGALLQQDQHLLAPDPGKAVPAGDGPVPLLDHRDVVPVGKMAADRLGRLGVVLLHLRERIVRQHHAPAEGVVGLVALEHHDLVRRIAQLHRDREIETGGSAAQTNDSHILHLRTDFDCLRSYARTNIFQA